MTGKKEFWATLYLVACWTLLPTLASCCWGFQDYLQDWVSARNWWAGKALYVSLHRAIRENVDLSQLPAPHDLAMHPLDPKCTPATNAHPPSTVLIFLPFALLPYKLSFIAWNLVSGLCLALSAGIVAEEMEIRPSLWVVLLLGPLGLLCGPLFEQMFLGQTNAVTLALLVLAWQAHRKTWQWWEGCWLGLAIAFKLFPAALLVIPLGSMRWRSLAAALGTALVVMLLSFSLFGWDIWTEYRNIGLPEAVVWGDAWPNASLSGFWKKLFVSQNLGLSLGEGASALGFWIGYVFSTGLVLVTTLVLALLRNRTTKSDNIYALAICAMLLLSPTCWPHYFLMLLLPVVLLWHSLPERSYLRWMFVASSLALLLPANFACAEPGWIRRVAGTSQTLSILAIHTYALSVLWLLAVVQEVRELRRRGAEVETPSQDLETPLAA